MTTAVDRVAIVEAYEAGRRAGRAEGAAEGLRQAETAILRWAVYVRSKGGNFLRVAVPCPAGCILPAGNPEGLPGHQTVDIPVEGVEFFARVVRSGQ